MKQENKLINTISFYHVDELCMYEEGCEFWTYRAKKSKCFLKSSDENRKPKKGAVSGSVGCSQAGKTKVSWVVKNVQI